jgi:hypothetical protein
MNSSNHSTSDWTDDPIQVDREFAKACEMHDYYHLSDHSLAHFPIALSSLETPEYGTLTRRSPRPDSRTPCPR